MECIATPLIAHPDSDRDWHDQDVLRLPAQAKQPALYMPLARNGPVDTKRRQVRHVRRHTVQNIRFSAGIQKRVRFDRAAVVKPTPASSQGSNTKTRKEWEDLLKSSIEGLQGLYNKMGSNSSSSNTNPATSSNTVVQTSPVLGDRLPKPDLATTLDHTDMAFRALQIASGGSRAPVSPSQYQAEEYDGDTSSGSEDSYGDASSEADSPVTPRSARMGSEETMDLDSGFMGMGIGYSG